MTLYDTAAELSATAADLAASISDDRACPGIVARARTLLDTLAAEIGDTPDRPPVPRGWLPARVLAHARARRALDENAIRDYGDGVTWDTPEFLRLNRAVAAAENGVPAWMQALTCWVIERRLRYWDHVGDTADYDRPLPVALTPKALATLAGDGQQ
jgi:hypothetical protein